MSNENATIKKDVGKFATSNEMRSRFDVITKDITKRMMDRITKEEFKKLTADYNTKIDGCVEKN